MGMTYTSAFVQQLADDIASMLTGGGADPGGIEARLLELCEANHPWVAAYWRATDRGRGVSDAMFKRRDMYHFAGQEPARVFETSGTSGEPPGRAAYSPRGMELMRLAILDGARRHLFSDGEQAAVIRLAPAEADAPKVIMAHGMELIAGAFGEPSLSTVVVGAAGLDLAQLRKALDRCVSAGVPAVLIGGTFAFVMACDAFENDGVRWELPAGSRLVDAGGHKGRVRDVAPAELRALAHRTFGVPDAACINIFGMTELASQLYDGHPRSVLPGGDRAKGVRPNVFPRVLDPQSMQPRTDGAGLLEVRDLCILDRPYTVLTGDVAYACPGGAAILGRSQRSRVRGCALDFESVT